MMPRLRGITRTHVVVAFAGFGVVALIAALMLANSNSDQKTNIAQTTQENYTKQLDALKDQLDRNEATRQQLTADRERFQAQITASIGQLIQAGQQPIIVAPDAVSPEAKEMVTTTTTQPPTVIMIPVPETTTTSTITTTEPPTTTTEPETPTTTEPPTTTSTTTTTEPPPPTTEPETTTTTEEIP